MKIISVFKTHFDNGFTDLSRNVRRNYCTELLEKLLSVCESTSDNPKELRYVWTVPSELLLNMLESDDTSNRNKLRLIKLIENDQVIWHALPFTTHVEFCGIEELVFGIRISQKLNERFNKNVVSAKMTDVPGYSRYLPSLLYASGIRFLHLGCNPASMPPDVPPIFWWEGPDGNRILTVYTQGNYGSGCIPPEDWKFPVWLAMTMTNDNMGPHSADVITKMQQQILNWDSDAEFSCGTLDDFYYAILPYCNDLPIIKADLADTWIHGVGTYPKEIAEIRKNRELLSALNGVSVLTGNSDAGLREKLDDALYNLLMFGEHTWGCDVKTHIHSRKYQKKDYMDWKNNSDITTALASWDEQRNRSNAAGLALKKALCDLHTDSEISLAYNRNGFMRPSFVKIPKGKTYSETDGTPLEIFDGIEFDEIKIQCVPLERIHYIKESEYAEKVQLPDVIVESSSNKITVKTPYHIANFSTENGRLVSLIDKSTQKECIGKSTDFYRYDIYDKQDIDTFQSDYLLEKLDWALLDFGREDYPAGKYRKTYYPKFNGIGVSQSGNSARLSIGFSGDEESVKLYGDAKEISVSITFYNYKPQIDFTCNLTDKQETPYLECGSFVLPLCDGKPEFCFSKLGETVYPARDIGRRCNTEFYCTDGFVHAQYKEHGITLFPHGVPLFSLGTNGMLKYKPEYKAPTENILIMNLFNNQWGTNFPQWISGNLSYSYTLLTNGNDEKEALREAQYYKAKTVLLKQTDNVPALFNLPDGIQILTADITSDGLYRIALKEIYGEHRDVSLDFSCFDKVYSADLRGIGERLDSNQFNDTFEPYGIRCFFCKK